MAFFDAFRRARQGLADRIFGRGKPLLPPNEVSRLNTWACLVGAFFWLGGQRLTGAGLLALGLFLDLLDGVSARRCGVRAPHVDWAADRWSELAWVGPLLLREPAGVGWAYLLLTALNVFLPRWGVPVLPLRHGIIVYALVRLRFL